MNKRFSNNPVPPEFYDLEDNCDVGAGSHPTKKTEDSMPNKMIAKVPKSEIDNLDQAVMVPNFSKLNIREAAEWWNQAAEDGVIGADMMAKWLRRCWKMEVAWNRAEIDHGDIRRAIDED